MRRQHLAVGVSPWKSSALESSREGGGSTPPRSASPPSCFGEGCCRRLRGSTLALNFSMGLRPRLSAVAALAVGVSPWKRGSSNVEPRRRRQHPSPKRRPGHPPSPLKYAARPDRFSGFTDHPPRDTKEKRYPPRGTKDHEGARRALALLAVLLILTHGTWRLPPTGSTAGSAPLADSPSRGE